MNFHELTAGLMLQEGPRAISEQEIVEFARRYDPQPFHVDRAAASASRWGGLIASGWMTCSVAMQLAVSCALIDSNSIGSPGVERLEWLRPVRPGDQLSLTMTVLESRVSSTGKVGVVRWQWELRNQVGAVVLRMIATSLFELAV